MKNEKQWAAPTPLRGNRSNLIEFPVNALPPILREMAYAVARTTSTDVSMAATAILSSVSYCFSGQFRIIGKKDHSEPLVIDSLIVAEASFKKSPVMKLISQPYQDYVQEYLVSFRENLPVRASVSAVMKGVDAYDFQIGFRREKEVNPMNKKGKTMKQKRISFGQGKGSLTHNNREFMADNVDPLRTPQNITFVRQPIGEAYDQLFAESTQRYNAKQKRNDRKVQGSYYEHLFGVKPYNTVRTVADKRKSFYEDVV